MSEGRSFGVNVTIGVHQLSQLTETYGEHLAETILGLCSNRAFLRTDDQKTADWMSKYVGNCLRSYDKQTFTYGMQHGSTYATSRQATRGKSRGGNRAHSRADTTGTADTEGVTKNETVTKQSTHSFTPGKPSTSTHADGTSTGTGQSVSHTDSASQTETETAGINWQQNESTSTGSTVGKNESSNESTANSKELRGEAAIEPHVFVTFPYPETDGVCEGVYRVPTLPFWRATLGAEEMAPQYAVPNRLNDWPATRTPEEDERVSKSTPWSDEDLNRLGLNLDPPSEPGQPGNIPQTTSPPDAVQKKLSYDSGSDAEVDYPNSRRPLENDFGF